jgi:hypothetical protein
MLVIAYHNSAFVLARHIFGFKQGQKSRESPAGWA